MVPEISTARDRCFFDTLGRFLPSLNSPENENIKKMKKKRLVISSIYTSAPKILIIGYTVPEI